MYVELRMRVVRSYKAYCTATVVVGAATKNVACYDTAGTVLCLRSHCAELPV